jgi:hypothetical protein
VKQESAEDSDIQTVYESDHPKLPVATYPLPTKVMKLFNQPVIDTLPMGSRMASFRVTNAENANDTPAVVTIDLNGNLSTLQKEYVLKFVPNAFASSNYPILAPNKPPTHVATSNTQVNDLPLPPPPPSPGPEDTIDFQARLDDEVGMSTLLHGFNMIPEGKDDESTETPTIGRTEDEEDLDPVSSEEDATVILKEKKKGKRTLRPPPKLTVKLRPRSKGESKSEPEDADDEESEFGGSGGGLDIL